MSTRYMKKVYGGDERIERDNENASDVEISISGNVKSNAFNVFDLLNQNSESEDKECEDRTIDDTRSNQVKSKKKKRRRKKETAKVQEKFDPESDENIDEIDKTVREINKLLGETSPGCSKQDADLQWIIQKPKECILTTQHKHLNLYNELKRIFGSKTVQAEQSKRRNRDQLGNFKKTWLISAKEDWPRIGKSGLSMSIDNSVKPAGNIHYFIYEHSPAYKQIQLKFLQAVESSNPKNLISIINAYPYHVDCLLQLAELCKLSEDLPLAAIFTEKALYCLECAFHPLFNVTTASCRLNYKVQQNRALFITLFKYLAFVAGRACYRTCLELCKLLLSLDPEDDPLAVVLCIDFYALRAREYEWFIEFCNLWDGTRNLTQLPNIAYSLALAYFHLGHIDTANELLLKALIMFPGVLMPLLDKCGIQADSKVMGHNFFNNTAKSTPPALEKLQDLYVVRTYYLWKEADILPWLEQGVHATLKRVDSKDDYVKYCEVKRSKRYQGRLPRNILRHIIVADLKDVTISGEEMQNEGPILSHDPLPPLDSIDIYKKPTTDNRSIQNNSNILSLFFSSFFVDIDGDVAAAALNGLNILEENDEHA